MSSRLCFFLRSPRARLDRKTRFFWDEKEKSRLFLHVCEGETREVAAALLDCHRRQKRQVRLQCQCHQLFFSSPEPWNDTCTVCWELRPSVVMLPSSSQICPSKKGGKRRRKKGYFLREVRTYARKGRLHFHYHTTRGILKSHDGGKGQVRAGGIHSPFSSHARNGEKLSSP